MTKDPNVIPHPEMLGFIPHPNLRASLVQEKTYLLVCQRYIELNPVRATMVDDTTWKVNCNGLNLKE